MDVAVIILGNNNTFYEFSSVNINDLIKHYQGDELPHDIKKPSDYGEYELKPQVVLNTRKRKRNHMRNKSLQMDKEFIDHNSHEQIEILDNDEDDEGEEEEDNYIKDTPKKMHITNSSTDSGVISTSSIKRSKLGDNIQSQSKDNNVDGQTRMQFRNLYDVTDHNEINGSSPFTPSNSMSFQSQTGPNFYNQSQSTLCPQSNKSIPNISTSSSLSHNSRKEHTQSLPSSGEQKRATYSSRPVLRVQIPSNNGSITMNQTSPDLNTGQKTTQLSIKLHGPVGLPDSTNSENNIPSNIVSQINNSSLPIDKHGDNASNHTPGMLNSGFLYNGLPSSIVPSPSIQQYFSTPLQPLASNMHNTLASLQHPHSYTMHKSLQHGKLDDGNDIESNNHSNNHHTTLHKVGILQPSADVNSATAYGPPTGSLPSKFVHDLMVQSPSNAMGMFQEWPFSVSGRIAVSGEANMSPSFSQLNSANLGLTPYLNHTQTPSGHRFFNFNESTDQDKEQDKKS